MFARLHDEGLGLVRRLARNFCEFVNGEVRQIVERVHAAVCQFADQFGRQSLQIAQVLGDLFHTFFVGNFHGQQSVLGTGTQFMHRVFVETFNFQHFL